MTAGALAATTNGSITYSNDLQSALNQCLGSAYSINACNDGGFIDGASCSGCGMAGPIPGTASCQATERLYSANRPGYCFTLESTTALAFVYPTTACPSGTGFVGASSSDCEPQGLITRSNQYQKYVGTPTDRNTCVGNPTNVITGGKVWAESDFVGGDDVPQFERFYNSLVLDDRVGLGVGWTHNYAKRLVFKLHSTVTAQRGDGASVPFYPGSNPGAYTTDPDVELQLAGTTEGGYRLTDRSGATEDYNPNGVMTASTTPGGQVTTYTYVGTTKNLQQVKGPFGHTLNFVWVGQALRTVSLPNGRVLTFTQSATKNLASVGNGDGTSRQYVYEDNLFKHALTGIVDERGVRVGTYKYNFESGTVERSEGAGGFGYTTFTEESPYYAVGTFVSDAEGRTQRFQPTGGGGALHLGEISYVVGAGSYGEIGSYTKSIVLTNTYDATSGKLTASTNGIGQRTELAYETAGGRVSQVSLAVGTAVQRTMSLGYSDAWLGTPSSMVSPSVKSGSSQAVTLGFGDARYRAQPTSISRAGYAPDGSAVGRSVSLAYAATGQVSLVDGPRTDVADQTSISYWTCVTAGRCGQVSSVTTALGQTTTFDAYDAAGLPTQETSPAGIVTHYGYDTRGRLTSTSEVGPGGIARTRAMAYDAAGRLIQLTTEDGISFTLENDDDSKIVAIVDPLGNRTAYGYSLARNPTSAQVKDAAGSILRNLQQRFDNHNQLATVNVGTGTAQLGYDLAGNLTSYGDPKQNPVAVRTLDAAGRLASEQNSGGGTTGVAYDANDEATLVTTPNGATWSYEVDDLGNEVAEHSPDRGTITRGFDAAGNMVWRLDARGIRSTYTYDALNRITSVSFSGGSGENVAYGYDGCPNGNGRLCSVQDASGSRSYSYDGLGRVASQTWTTSGSTFTTSYSWTAGGRLSSTTYPSGRVVTYSRDAMARIASIGSGSTAYASGRTYRGDGLLASQTLGNGISETRGYNLQGQLTTMTVGGSTSLTYDFDANGNMVSSSVNGASSAFTYDAMDRLTGEPGQSYTYDSNGNRLTDGIGSFGYQANSNRLASSPMGSISLDAAGNVASTWSGWTFNYAQSGQLASVQNGTSATSYTYREDGLRAAKVGSGGATLYHYDDQDRLIAESDSSGSFIKEYVWDDDDHPVAQIEGTRTTFLHADQLGTPRIGTDAQAAAVWQWFARPFGTGPPYGSVTVNLRMPGQYFDAETGLHQNRFRTYDPNSGRYLESDPLGLYAGINSFAYVDSNPLGRVDPDGRLWWWAIAGLANAGFTAYDLYQGYKDYKACGASSLPGTLATAGANLLSVVNPELAILRVRGLLKAGRVAAEARAVSREERWLQLANQQNTRLPKEVVDHVNRTGGRGVSDRFGLELAHPPKRAAAQGYDYSEAIPKTAADHRGIQHRYLRERSTGTTISVPSRARSGGALDLPPPGALP